MFLSYKSKLKSLYEQYINFFNGSDGNLIGFGEGGGEGM